MEAKPDEAVALALVAMLKTMVHDRQVELVRAELEDTDWRGMMIWTSGVLTGALTLDDPGAFRSRIEELTDGLMASLKDREVEL